MLVSTQKKTLKNKTNKPATHKTTATTPNNNNHNPHHHHHHNNNNNNTHTHTSPNPTLYKTKQKQQQQRREAGQEVYGEPCGSPLCRTAPTSGTELHFLALQTRSPR